jgi:signal peptidase I
MKELLLRAAKLIFRLYGESGVELPSPYNDIDPKDIKYNKSTKEIRIKNIPTEPWITDVGGSNSMEPLIDVGHRVLLSDNSKYLAEDKLKVGDIIVYEKWVFVAPGALQFMKVIHSIIEIGQDDEGWYCITKGLNNSRPDAWKVRWEEIRYVALGVIWGKEA